MQDEREETVQVVRKIEYATSDDKIARRMVGGAADIVRSNVPRLVAIVQDRTLDSKALAQQVRHWVGNCARCIDDCGGQATPEFASLLDALLTTSQRLA